MSEDLEPDDWSADRADTPQTGVDELDQVIAAVAALTGDRVEDHVVALEEAHVTLRRALDQPPAPS